MTRMVCRLQSCRDTGGFHRDDEVICMRYVPTRKTCALVAILSVGALGCSESANPVAPALRPNAHASLSSTGNGNGGSKAQVKAIHVRISNMFVGTTIVDQYSFHAKRHGNPGKFFLYQLRIIEGVEEAVVIASGPMECLSVTGNKARVGGRVAFTTFPEGIPMGSELTWSVTDNGKSANADDTASQPLGNDARAYCAGGLAYPETPVESGKVQVKS
jgi:hypothetical protein